MFRYNCVCCRRSYKWVKEPLYDIYPQWRQGVKDLYGQCRDIIKGMDIRGVEFQGMVFHSQLAWDRRRGNNMGKL